MSEQLKISRPRGAQKWQHLSGQQRELLRALHGKSGTLNQLQKKLKIDAATLDRWLGAKRFRAALESVMRQLRRRRDLAIEVCSLRASEKISLMVNSKKTSVSRLASMDMMRLTQKVELAKRGRERRKRAAGAGEARAEAPPLRLPDDLPPEEAERLLTELERSQSSK